jgi:rhomboid protease GluP
MEVTANPAELPRSQWMSFLLIGINVVVFLLLQSSGGTTYENLLLFGAKENGLIAEGQIARLFFPMFLHANILHLAFNMWGIYQVGRVLEIMIGSKRLLFLYLASGVTGNLASFAFVDPLSVGASGALFGFLSCLWVLQKYEEKLLEDMNEPIQKSTVGLLILFNFAISFIIPNIDWACHLGGCLAGIIIGMTMVMRHKRAVRVAQVSRYLAKGTGLPKPSPWERPAFYQTLMVALNLGLASAYFRIGPTDRAFGLGTYAAAQNNTERKSLEVLPSFRVLVASQASESNPDRLSAAVIKLHVKGSHVSYASAVALYDVLIDMHSQGVGGSDFVSASVRSALFTGKGLAMQSQPPSNEVMHVLKTLWEPDEDPQKVCLEAGNLMRTVGFFGLAGRLFECAFYQDTQQLQTAVDVFECYWNEEPEEKRHVARFRYVFETLLGSQSIVKTSRGSERFPEGQSQSERL